MVSPELLAANLLSRLLYHDFSQFNAKSEYCFQGVSYDLAGGDKIGLTEPCRNRIVPRVVRVEAKDPSEETLLFFANLLPGKGQISGRSRNLWGTKTSARP